MDKLSKIVAYLQSNFWYSMFIIFLALLSLLIFIYDFVFVQIGGIRTDTDWTVLVNRIDMTVACIFLTDFFSGLFFNKEMTKKDYLRLNWLNLLSSIPITSEVTRALRVLRILRAIRVARAATNLYFARKRSRYNREHGFYDE